MWRSQKAFFAISLDSTSKALMPCERRPARSFLFTFYICFSHAMLLLTLHTTMSLITHILYGDIRDRLHFFAITLSKTLLTKAVNNHISCGQPRIKTWFPQNVEFLALASLPGKLDGALDSLWLCFSQSREYMQRDTDNRMKFKFANWR